MLTIIYDDDDYYHWQAWRATEWTNSNKIECIGDREQRINWPPYPYARGVNVK